MTDVAKSRSWIPVCRQASDPEREARGSRFNFLPLCGDLLPLVFTALWIRIGWSSGWLSGGTECSKNINSV